MPFQVSSSSIVCGKKIAEWTFSFSMSRLAKTQNSPHSSPTLEFMKTTFSGFVQSMGDAVASASDAATTAVSASLTTAKNSAEKAGHSALEFGMSAGEALGGVAHAASSFTSRAGESVSDGAAKSFAAVKSGAIAAGESVATGAKSAAIGLGAVADSAGHALGQLGVLVGDLNGDGKVDIEDAKIAAAKMRDVAGATAAELGQLGKSALQSQLVKDTAAGAVVGGVLASAIPFVGTFTGATVGAAVGAYKSIGKK